MMNMNYQSKVKRHDEVLYQGGGGGDGSDGGGNGGGGIEALAWRGPLVACADYVHSNNTNCARRPDRFDGEFNYFPISHHFTTSPSSAFSHKFYFSVCFDFRLSCAVWNGNWEMKTVGSVESWEGGIRNGNRNRNRKFKIIISVVSTILA